MENAHAMINNLDSPQRPLGVARGPRRTPARRASAKPYSRAPATPISNSIGSQTPKNSQAVGDGSGEGGLLGSVRGLMSRLWGSPRPMLPSTPTTATATFREPQTPTQNIQNNKVNSKPAHVFASPVSKSFTPTHATTASSSSISSSSTHAAGGRPTNSAGTPTVASPFAYNRRLALASPSIAKTREVSSLRAEPSLSRRHSIDIFSKQRGQPGQVPRKGNASTGKQESTWMSPSNARRLLNTLESINTPVLESRKTVSLPKSEATKRTKATGTTPVHERAPIPASNLFLNNAINRNILSDKALTSPHRQGRLEARPSTPSLAKMIQLQQARRLMAQKNNTDKRRDEETETTDETTNKARRPIEESKKSMPKNKRQKASGGKVVAIDSNEKEEEAQAQLRQERIDRYKRRRDQKRGIYRPRKVQANVNWRFNARFDISSDSDLSDSESSDSDNEYELKAWSSPPLKPNASKSESDNSNNQLDKPDPPKTSLSGALSSNSKPQESGSSVTVSTSLFSSSTTTKASDDGAKTTNMFMSSVPAKTLPGLSEKKSEAVSADTTSKPDAQSSLFGGSSSTGFSAFGGSTMLTKKPSDEATKTAPQGSALFGDSSTAKFSGFGAFTKPDEKTADEITKISSAFGTPATTSVSSGFGGFGTSKTEVKEKSAEVTENSKADTQPSSLFGATSTGAPGTSPLNFGTSSSLTATDSKKPAFSFGKLTGDNSKNELSNISFGAPPESSSKPADDDKPTQSDLTDKTQQTKPNVFSNIGLNGTSNAFGSLTKSSTAAPSLFGSQSSTLKSSAFETSAAPSFSTAGVASAAPSFGGEKTSAFGFSSTSSFTPTASTSSEKPNFQFGLKPADSTTSLFGSSTTKIPVANTTDFKPSESKDSTEKPTSIFSGFSSQPSSGSIFGAVSGVDQKTSESQPPKTGGSGFNFSAITGSSGPDSSAKPNVSTSSAFNTSSTSTSSFNFGGLTNTNTSYSFGSAGGANTTPFGQTNASGTVNNNDDSMDTDAPTSESNTGFKQTFKPSENAGTNTPQFGSPRTTTFSAQPNPFGSTASTQSTLPTGGFSFQAPASNSNGQPPQFGSLGATKPAAAFGSGNMFGSTTSIASNSGTGTATSTAFQTPSGSPSLSFSGTAAGFSLGANTSSNPNTPSRKIAKPRSRLKRG